MEIGRDRVEIASDTGEIIADAGETVAVSEEFVTVAGEIVSVILLIRIGSFYPGGNWQKRDYVRGHRSSVRRSESCSITAETLTPAPC
jgi:hypothetical protein